MRNFDFLKDIQDFSKLYEFCDIAELSYYSSTITSALFSRKALEYLVKSVYNIQNWEYGERTDLIYLINSAEFIDFINDRRLISDLHFIRKIGNDAAHEDYVSKRNSFFALLNLHNFVGSVLMMLDIIDVFPRFNKELLNKKVEMFVIPEPDTTPEKAIAEKYSGRLAKDAKLISKKPEYFTEAETRRIYIDQLLNEAGWQVVADENVPAPSKAGIEIRIDGMPNNSNEGYADYVLYGRDGKPLAVIEAKRTSKEASVGKHQATLYADALEKQYGYRPVIYYTNGYETFVIDGLGYPPREVYGFHSINELELLIQRKGRNKIVDLNINKDIAGRHYQVGAVSAVCDHFNNNHRRALLVMATGTGKTRVSVSLVDVLMRNNWVKNVLFLADRTSLVNQAHRSFSSLLDATTTILSEKDSKIDLNARIMFSTYQTMINYIDMDTKEFSIGRFDLIIIDEAHRSVFGSYGTIFNYFDSLLVGLTATPREEIDRSTYELFNMEEGKPNFSYELGKAISDGYLVPYKGLIRHSAHINRGIRYEDLSETEKEQLEKVWEYESAKNSLDEREYKRDISGKELFSYIYNDNTIDKVLQDLMTNGQKVQDGETIGKTIIFAYNHKHASRIVERFYILYPQYGPEFCVLIDNTVSYAQSLINKFELRNSEPHIAVSVDMLDTGIDVPDILNLLFFKIVRSKIKFMQMIGRGTRISENIFGDDEHKKEFYIFDYCNNFDYFDNQPNDDVSSPPLSLTERLFDVKTDIVYELQNIKYQEDDFLKEMRFMLIDDLRTQIEALNRSHIAVRKHLNYVDKYVLEKVWENISPADTVELKRYISPLIMPNNEDVNTKRFDLLVLIIIVSQLSKEVNSSKSKKRIITIAEILSEKITIPDVRKKIDIIKELLEDSFWQNLTIPKLERIRVELRDLMEFLKGEKTEIFTINIEDTLTAVSEASSEVYITSYKKRVADYLTKNFENNEALLKIFRIEKLTESDILELERIFWNELGTKEDFENYVGNRFGGGNLAAFIRSIIGIDKDIALNKFTNFLSDNTLSAEQQEYIHAIVNYVCQNGDITPEVIVSESPFQSYDWQGVFEDNVFYISQYVKELHNAIS